MTTTRALLALSAVAVVLTTSSAQAQSIPPEGFVTVTFTAPIPAPKPMPIGGGREFVLLNDTMTATNEAGNPVLNNMGGPLPAHPPDGSRSENCGTGSAAMSMLTAIKFLRNATSSRARLTIVS
jgi:hypothetical protein